MKEKKTESPQQDLNTGVFGRNPRFWHDWSWSCRSFREGVRRNAKNGSPTNVNSVPSKPSNREAWNLSLRNIVEAEKGGGT